MVSFEGFTLSGNAPIYQQILLFLKRGAVSGTIRDGDELPSRRVLSALLGVNPNTVQKAYRLLEEEGLMTSHTGGQKPDGAHRGGDSAHPFRASGRGTRAHW